MRRYDYRRALPLLLHWLPRLEEQHLQWAVASRLGVRWARPMAAPALISLFRQAPDDPYSGFKWAIGKALGVVADDSVLPDLVPLVCDQRHGHARQMLVPALGRMRDPRAVDLLIDLLADADAEIVEQALLALGQRKAVQARRHVVAALGHDDRYVRRAATRTLATLDRVAARTRPSQDAVRGGDGWPPHLHLSRSAPLQRDARRGG